ncbi:HNH endonuclease family protein [Microbacterium nymphoidis]|uniref:HNH endonuclease family protein n=1 Tax=Microbacterium nymphoidis TaxID=2898586 RepID=UPI001E56D561|nr:HNH endonuclease family protein [Microbacterium nymphoidis]MCD2498308.1 HNH endonuclease family protein [Microbacterium nymphoidis]
MGIIVAVAVLGGMRVVLPELIPDAGPTSSVGATAPADTATTPAGEPGGGPSSPTGAATPSADGWASQHSSPAEILAALAVLDTIPAGPALSSGLPYDRDAFGQRWADTDHNGCDTRNDVLRRDLHDAVAKPGTRECVVLTGVLDDAYTGERIEFRRGQGTSELVQIDHIVPLAWAWRQGADGWSPERRLELANDPANLQAVDGAANQSKSASGPARWLPPDAAYHCTYATRFTQVVADYGLALPADDRAAVRAVLLHCS